jgi:hypothetical protein
MTTILVKGQDVRVGDDLWFLGSPHRITRIEPYVHPVVTRNEEWRVAKSDGPDGQGKHAWGMTLEFCHGYAGDYEITLVPGDDREHKGRFVDPDDYLDPFLSTAAELWARYQREGMPAGKLWRPWVESLPVSDMPEHESGMVCFTGRRT